MRKFVLITLAVLFVSQVVFAQMAPTSSKALQNFSAVQKSGKAAPLLPKALTNMKARPTIWVTGQKWVKSTLKQANVPGEPWFCDYNTGYQVAVCPKGLQTAYQTSFPSANGGAGMVIAILDYFAYPSAEANFAQFNADMHLPPCTTANGCFTSLDLSGGIDGTGTGWDLESMLDIEYAHAMAPNAKIIYVQGDPYGDGSFEEQVAGSLSDVVSNSWTYNSGEYWDFLEPVWAGIGKPLMFASGDGSAWPYYSGVSYPCTSPSVTCVGGTSLYLNPNLTRLAEYGWAGAGGGCSQNLPMPAWQGNVGSGVCSPYRAAPDVAAIADSNTPVAVYLCNWAWGCGYFGVGGTSVATPVLSGLVADIDAARTAFGKAKLTTFAPPLYPAAAYNYNYYFFDVVNGYNGFYAGPQYDLITGLGVPSGKAIGSRFFGIP